MNERKMRYFELLVLLAVTFVQPFVSSLCLFLGVKLMPQDPTALNIRWFSGVLDEMAGLTVLAYILFRRSRTLEELIAFRFRDIPISLGLWFVSILASLIVSSSIYYGYNVMTGELLNLEPQNIEFIQSKFTFGYVLFIMINPIFEELVFRAHIINEIEFLANTRWAIITSVLLQSSYHLYQGITSTLSIAAVFLVFSIYYCKYRRVMPVILAHLFIDIAAMFSYAKF